jgi:hypothetical protein
MAHFIEKGVAYDAECWTTICNLQGTIIVDLRDNACAGASKELRDGNTASNWCSANLHQGLDDSTCVFSSVAYVVTINAHFITAIITRFSGKILERYECSWELDQQVLGNSYSNSRYGDGTASIEASIGCGDTTSELEFRPHQ